EHLEWKPPGGVQSILGWLWHIAETEDQWVQAVILGRQPFAPRRKSFLTDRTDVLRYLEETRAATEHLLQDLPAERLWEPRPLPPGQRLPTTAGTSATLHSIFSHVFHHEYHHRAQIYLHLRLMGIEPPPF
ncbi:MAG TPA: DinB family protein, partial [Symbiobacteriaceae bacterium]|nr:DinB family protein [Symbiobacteriaceae bacterium]